MNLRDKLKRFERDSKPREPVSDDIEYINKKAFKHQIISNEQGSYLKATKNYEGEYLHGLYNINKIFDNLDQKIVSIIANTDLENVEKNIKENLIFIDTETTGLMGGTGTVSFLIGVGYFKKDHFIIEQFVMRDYDEEPPLLSDLKELINKFDYMVSFNGKSFDLPLIKTRLILNKFNRPSFDLHIDLLHSSRRIWSFLDSCSLNSLENNILDFNRIGDIPGHLIPELYFKFLKSKDLKLLAPVLEHNIYDILSLITLFTHLKEVYLNNVENLNSYELFNLGKVKEKEKKYKVCINYFEKAVKNTEDNTIKYKSLKKLSWQYKRTNQYNKAVEIWEEMIEENKMGTFPFIELAKYFEHEKKNFKEAKKYTDQALSLLQEKRTIINNYEKKQKKLKHRQHRLDKKINSD